MKGFLKRAVTWITAITVLMTSIVVMPVNTQAAVKPWSKGSDGKYYNDKGQVIKGAVKKGIDVSSWQGKINWDKVKADGVEFAFVRVGHGDDPLDSYYKYNLKEANRVGIPVGVYFYSTTTSTTQSKKDAQRVIKAIQGYKISYPVVVDMESSTQLGLTDTQRSAIAMAFLKEVKAAGYYPMVYCNEYWYNNYLDIPALKGLDMWVARYASTYDTTLKRTVWQCTSSGRVNGIPPENTVDINFAFVDYTKKIVPRTYAKDPDDKAGWVKVNGKLKYRQADGTYLTNVWKTIGGKKYHFNSKGYVDTGWLQYKGMWFYLDSKGVMQKGWVKVGGKNYYLESNGKMATGWKKVGGKWYYLQSDGAMKTGWLKLNGKTYYLHKNGQMEIGWETIGGKKFFFDKNGVQTFGWIKYKGNMFYVEKSGLARNKWVQIKGQWYFFRDDGVMYHSKWIKWKGEVYYLKSNGTMKTGWLLYKGKYYYLSSSGAAYRNTTKVIDGKKYKFDRNGVRIG